MKKIKYIKPYEEYFKAIAGQSATCLWRGNKLLPGQGFSYSSIYPFTMSGITSSTA
jgi:hypothetical protein